MRNPKYIWALDLNTIKDEQPMEYRYDFALSDAHELNKMYPDSFQIPSTADIDRLKVGDYVKIVIENTHERCWWKIQTINKDRTKFKVGECCDTFFFEPPKALMVEPKHFYDIDQA